METIYNYNNYNFEDMDYKFEEYEIMDTDMGDCDDLPENIPDRFIN